MNVDVITFMPMWKLNEPPIKLIKYISTPPKIELAINFNIFFNGRKNIFPNIPITIIHAKKVINIFVSKLIPPVLITYYVHTWTNILLNYFILYSKF